MSIKKRRRRLANGKERVYTYRVSPDGYFTQLSARDSSDLPPPYRKREKNRIVAALLANSDFREKRDKK